jgi:hypothetical protein
LRARAIRFCSFYKELFPEEIASRIGNEILKLIVFLIWSLRFSSLISFRQKLDFSSFLADVYFCYDWTEREGGLKELYQLSARSENQAHALWFIPAVIERRDIFVMEQDELVRYRFMVVKMFLLLQTCDP